MVPVLHGQAPVGHGDGKCQTCLHQGLAKARTLSKWPGPKLWSRNTYPDIPILASHWCMHTRMPRCYLYTVCRRSGTLGIHPPREVPPLYVLHCHRAHSPTTQYHRSHSPLPPLPLPLPLPLAMASSTECPPPGSALPRREYQAWSYWQWWSL